MFLKFVCFPPFLPPFKKSSPFWLKFCILVGNRQTKQMSPKNEKFECFRCFFIPWLHQYFKFERVMIVQTRQWWKKSSIFSHHRRVSNNHNSFKFWSFWCNQSVQNNRKSFAPPQKMCLFGQPKNLEKKGTKFRGGIPRKNV